jgi:hypothetical protein
MLSRRSFISSSCGAFAASLALSSKLSAVEPIEPDHIVLGCRNLEDGIAYVETLSGYRADVIGPQPGLGTRNAFLKIGYRCYLEILAPDPAQPELTWHKELADLQDPLMVSWALLATNLESYAARLRKKGIACIGPTPGSQTMPNGEVLRWKTVVLENDQAGILPFYIEWAEDSPHPSTFAPGACLYRRMNNTGHVLRSPSPGPEFQRVPQRDVAPAQIHAIIEGRFGEFELNSRSVPSEAWSKQPPPKPA